MRNRRSQFDVAHALTTHFGQRNFYAALLANDTTMLEALVLAAQALIVFDRSKNFGAEQTVTLRLERPIVNGLRLFDFAIRPGPNFFRRRETNLDRVELFILLNLLE